MRFACVLKKLVCYVRNQSHLTCTLDCYCKFTLVSSANACHTTRQNFSAFCQELTKFSNIFVVDCFGLFYTKSANLATSRSSDRSFCNFFVFHCCSPCLLERHVVIRNFLQRIDCLISGRTSLCCLTLCCTGSATQKFYLFCTNFECLALYTVTFVATCLDATANGNLATFCKVFHTVLCQSVPRYNVDEVGSGIFPTSEPVHSDGETAVGVATVQCGCSWVLC